MQEPVNEGELIIGSVFADKQTRRIMYWNEMKEKMSIKICQLTENKTLLKNSNYSSCNKGSIPTRE